MGEEAPPAAALPLERTAALLGGYRWLEERLFGLTGLWATDDPWPAAQLLFDDLSAQHAWHAEIWTARLPVLDSIDPEVLDRPPSAEVAATLDRLEAAGRAAAGGPGEVPEGVVLTVTRLAGLARVVLPRLVVTYRRHLERTVAVTDRPVARALRLVLADERAAWEEAETMLEHLGGGPAELRALSQIQTDLEAGLIEAGVGAGLVSWPA